MVPDGFGARLAQLRRERGVTQKELGAVVGISARMVAYYEGKEGNPSVSLLPKLADALGVPIDDLFPKRRNSSAQKARVNLRLLRRLQKVENLPEREREALLRVFDAMVSKASGQ
jgi:transcriptional regulator with XRE-family HTH domain